MCSKTVEKALRSGRKLVALEGGVHTHRLSGGLGSNEDVETSAWEGVQSRLFSVPSGTLG